MDKWALETPRGVVHYWVSRPDGTGCEISGEPDVSHPWLFMLHGLTADHRLFEDQIAAFEGRFPLIVWDAPLHGESRPYHGFSFAQTAEDMAAILDAQGVETCVLVGQSMGGYDAQHFIARFPSRVRGFFGIDTASIAPSFYTASDRWWLRQVGWMSRLYTAHGLVEGIAKASTVTESGRSRMVEMLEVYPKDELCRLMGMVYKALANEAIDVSIPCPVHLVLGEQDKIGKMQAYNRAWSERAGYPLQIIEGAGHNSNVDAPAVVNAALETFCANL